MAEKFLTVSLLHVKDIARFFERISISPDFQFANQPCWLFTGKLNGDGYARVSFRGKHIMLHRIMYAWLCAPVPEWTPCGITIDHLCRRRHCCNPSHMELVPHKTNMERSNVHGLKVTHCIHGHPYDQSNTRYRKNGTRYCGTCHVENGKHRRLLHRQPVQPMTHCRSGRHLFTGENVQVRANGSRVCVRCIKIWREKNADRLKKYHKDKRVKLKLEKQLAVIP